MKLISSLLSAAMLFAVSNLSRADAPATQPTGLPLSQTVTDIDGKPCDLSQYKGKVVMIVNVASKCGLTKQYAGIEALYKKYKDQGLVVIGFPANNFGGQEPGTDEEIKTFCTGKYDVSFPMMSKISVKGADQAPLYKILTSTETAGKFSGDIGWNFTKFLVGRDGMIVNRFASKLPPEDASVTASIEAALAAK